MVCSLHLVATVATLGLSCVLGYPQPQVGSIPQPAVPVAAAVPVPVAVPRGFVVAREITSYFTGELIPVDANSYDINGCLVGEAGERVCATGAVGAANDRVTFRGNVGHKGVGSNGNAAPVSAAGLPVDPAAETYKKQLVAYELWVQKQQEWAERQQENNKKIIG